MNDNRTENINRYLDNEMSDDERIAFEEQLRNDEELAQDLEFHKDFHGYAERKKPKLRQDLSDLGDKYIIEPNKKKSAFPRWILIPILLLTAIGIYFSFFHKKNIAQENTSPTEVETQLPTNNSEENIDDNSNDNSNKNIEEPVEEQTTNTPELSPNQPIAALDKADFIPNPVLEAEIKEMFRATAIEDSTILSSPKSDAVFKFERNIPILIEGLTTISPNYVINIYSNRPFDFENEFPVLNAPMSGTAENGQYRFRFAGDIPLKKGLYYLVIKQDDLIEVLHISRFTVE